MPQQFARDSSSFVCSFVQLTKTIIQAASSNRRALLIIAETTEERESKAKRCASEVRLTCFVTCFVSGSARYPFQELWSYRFPESIPVTSIPAFTQQSVRYHVAARNVPNVEMCVHCRNDFATKWIASELVVIRKHFSFQRNCDDDANYLIGEHSPSNNECAK